MKVKDLIQELEKKDQDLDILINGGMDDYGDIMYGNITDIEVDSIGRGELRKEHIIIYTDC